MNIRGLFAIGLTGLLAGANAQGQLANADLEDWNGNQPAQWTTIDSGISLARSTSLVYSGQFAAAITLTTTNQSDTDFRQSMAVQAGQQYTVSVWVYHTEGSAAARLYVDGYHNYSDPNLTGQWQQLTYTYSASATGEIEVGLRFYDQPGFDGSEIVHIDNFAPAAEPPGSGSCQATPGQMTLTTDNYGSETSWVIKDSNNVTKASGQDYASNSQYTESVCLAAGQYTLTVSDSYGDGMCCSFGNGSYSLRIDGTEVASGGQFGSSENTPFSVGTGSGSGTNPDYYASAEGKTGYALKTALYDIINNHTAKSYSDLWGFYLSDSLDTYDEQDATIYDIYSENVTGSDPYTFVPGNDQCGNYRAEGDCYNREHSFPRSWFGGAIAPMNTDIHHVFATDGYVNSQRSSYPYGEVGSSVFVSGNGAKLGSARNGLGYGGTVFEPADAFKGDVARAYFYMATRYENIIGSWQSQSGYADAVLDGTSNQVFEPWQRALLLQWHNQDPVSQFERDRNDAAEQFQGNRNPFIDNPQWVSAIWSN